MQIPSGIQITRFIPEALVDRWVKGDIRLFGGELRDLKGRIVGFVTEGPELARQVQSGQVISPANILAAANNAQLAASLAAGIGLVNLGVQVATLAIMVQRFNRINAKIDGLHHDLLGIAADAGWLKNFSISALRADVANAFAIAERAERRSSMQLFDEAKSKSDRARRHLINCIADMSGAPDALGHCSLICEFTKMTALLTVCEAKCDETLEGPDLAANGMKATVADLRNVVGTFAKKARNFAGSPVSHLKVGSSGREAVVAGVRDMKDVIGRVEAHASQYRLRSILGLNALGWNQLLASDGDGALSCLSFQGEEGERLAVACYSGFD
jgi:hypothetical protein